MTNKKINPRLIELAGRTHSPELAERTKIEEEERERQRTERLKEQEEFKNYLEKLKILKVNELETAIYTFVNHPKFPIIYNQANTIDNTADRWAYILRKAYKISEETGTFVGDIFYSNDVLSKKKLEEYGIYLLCPYFRLDDKVLTTELCLIDNEPILASCKGQHQFRNGLCKPFEDRSIKAASNLINLPKIERAPLKKYIPKIEVEPVDIDDLYDWWEENGKYD